MRLDDAKKAGRSAAPRRSLIAAMAMVLALVCCAVTGCSSTSNESKPAPATEAQAQGETESSTSPQTGATDDDTAVEEEVAPVDKTALSETIANAEAVESSGYTKESYAKFADRLTEAKEALADDSCTQDQIDGAVANLEAAYQALAVKFNKKNYKSVAYSKIARNPDDYEGKQLKFSGKVVQVMEGDEETQIRLATDDDYDDIVLVGYDPAIMDKRVLEDDTVTVYGISVGLITYESTMGGNITIPALAAEKITIDEEA